MDVSFLKTSPVSLYKLKGIVGRTAVLDDIFETIIILCKDGFHGFYYVHAGIAAYGYYGYIWFYIISVHKNDYIILALIVVFLLHIVDQKGA